jgi:hypothetical protein
MNEAFYNALISSYEKATIPGHVLKKIAIEWCEMNNIEYTE